MMSAIRAFILPLLFGAGIVTLNSVAAAAQTASATITCASTPAAPPCPPSFNVDPQAALRRDATQAVVSGETNKGALVKLTADLGATRAQLAGLRRQRNADADLLAQLQAQVADLENQVHEGCFGLKEVAAQAACFNLVKANTAETQQAALTVFQTALVSGTGFRGTVVVGGVKGVSGGFYADFETKPETTLPAFARSRVVTTESATTSQWGILAPAAIGCGAGALAGYAVSDGVNIDFTSDKYDEGDEMKGAALGCAIGLVGGAIAGWAHDSPTSP